MNDKTMPAGETESRVGAALRVLPEMTPPPGLVARLDELVAETARPEPAESAPQGRRWFALAASVAIAVWVALPRLATDYGAGVGPAAGSPVEAGADVPVATHGQQLDALMAQSRYLESVLDAMPRRGRVQRVGTASTITALEDRVALIDAQLSASDLSTDADGRAVLWRERVGLMNTLVALQAPPATSVTL